MGNLDYPDWHIEVDPHLVWVLPTLLLRYPRARYVHLERNKEECVLSLSKRGSIEPLAKAWFMVKTVDHVLFAERFYAFVNNTISVHLRDAESFYKRYSIESAYDLHWHDFTQWIGAKGDIRAGRDEFKLRYNQS
jgi:hypothetical protein